MKLEIYCEKTKFIEISKACNIGGYSKVRPDQIVSCHILTVTLLQQGKSNSKILGVLVITYHHYNRANGKGFSFQSIGIKYDFHKQFMCAFRGHPRN